MHPIVLSFSLGAVDILGYTWGMENVAVHLPRQLVEQVDSAARDEMRSRSNLVRVLVSEGLARREAGAQDDKEAS
jgi:metal-responsive CopG/Arc/MetJ family transcriptional regulator